MNDRKICVERCRSNSIGSQFHDPQVIDWVEVAPEKAKELLATEGVNGFYHRITPPDITGMIPDDHKRYAADCAACGIENVYAGCE